MQPTLLTTLLTLLPLTTALPSTLNPRTQCSTIEPSLFFQIYEEDMFRGQTSGLGPFFPSNEYSFALQQQANNVNERDLVVSFKNVNCSTRGRGKTDKCRLEFAFTPKSRIFYSSGNTEVDVFAINGELPTFVDFEGQRREIPTWDSTEAQTGAKVGDFTFPSGNRTAREKVFRIGRVECAETINLRFSITNDKSEAGDLNYFQGPGVSGLRLVCGC